MVAGSGKKTTAGGGRPKQDARQRPGVHAVSRETAWSQPQRHHHVPAALASCLADQGRGIGIAQLQDHELVAQGRQGIEQVVHVEADGQAVDLGVGLDLFLHLFLFGVVGTDLQLARRHLDADAAGGADSAPPAESARGQLELFGSLLSTFADKQSATDHHQVEVAGSKYQGSWEVIVRRMRDAIGVPSNSMHEFMNEVATHGYRQTGVRIPTDSAERFIKGSATAGLLRIVK